MSRVLNALKALDGQPVLDENGDPDGAVFDSTLTAPEFNPVQSYDVQEDTIAAYLNANFKSDKWFANLGVRWVPRTRRRRRLSTPSCSSMIRRRGPHLESRRHLQPRGAADAGGQLHQAAAVAQLRLLAARGSDRAGGDCTHDDATLAQSARADAHG
jgi:hypothetical protein